ncbi:MAG: Coq4 family protein [Pseudomonadota bacterium]
MTSKKEPIIDRDFAERFLWAADRPMEYGVYFLFHDWWAEAPQRTIDAYMQELHAIEGAREFLAARNIPEPIEVERLASCAEGTLGKGYYDFVVENNLMDKFAVNYREFNKKLHASGKLDRLPEDMSYMMVRGTQIHDFQHVLTGFDSSPLGELKLAAFYLAQLRFPYHAMRMAVTFAHAAFVNPTMTVDAMDAVVEGWSSGRQSGNINFAPWEDYLDTPVAQLRDEFGIQTEIA